MGRPLSDAELRQVTEYIAHRYLEVERGLRDKRCLQRFLTPDAYAAQHTPNPSRFASAGVVSQTDIGKMTFQRHGDTVHAVVPTRQEGDRWGALLLELRSNGRDVWRVTELTRAQDRNLARVQAVPDPVLPREPESDVHQAAQTLAAAQMAYTAVRQRYTRAVADLARVAPEKLAAEVRAGEVIRTPGTPASWVEIADTEAGANGDVRITSTAGGSLRLPGDRPVATLVTAGQDPEATQQAADAATRTLTATAEALTYWNRQVADLEGVRDELIRRRDLDAELPVPTPAVHLTATLGAPPTDADARAIWDDAADRIQGYRDRWDIADPRSALGARPDDLTQRSDRDATIAALRQLTGRLAQRQPETLERSSPREDQARDPFALAPPGTQR